MRPYRAAGLLLCLLLAACGDEAGERPGARVRIFTSSVDGPAEGRIEIESAEQRGKVYTLERLGDDPELYFAPGAPAGRYRVFTDKDWGMLWAAGLGSSTPMLRGAGEPVTSVRLGRPFTIYIAPTDPADWQLGDTWGADVQRASDPKGGFRRAVVKQQIDPEGIVSLQFRPEDWQLGNVIRIVGQMTSGHVSKLLNYVVKDAKRTNLPRLALVHGAAHEALRLVLVPPPGTKQVPDGVRAQVALRGVPFPKAYEAASHRGEVRFDTVAALGKGLRVALPDSGEHALWELGAEAWRLGGTMFLLAFDPKDAVEVTLSNMKEPDDAITEARVRFDGGAAFARVPLIGDGAKRRMVTVPGKQEWLLKTASGAWHHVAHDDAEVASYALLASDKGCRMKGTVRGAGLGFRVVFRLVLEPYAAGSETLFPARKAGGFTAAVSDHGEYDVSLPPGTYEIQVIGPTGGKSRAVSQVLGPGQLVRRNLSAL